jgi:hypothetical protein
METIPGGAYKSPDGTWHDAHGKPIAAPVIAPATAPVLEVEPEPIAPKAGDKKK